MEPLGTLGGVCEESKLAQPRLRRSPGDGIQQAGRCTALEPKEDRNLGITCPHMAVYMLGVKKSGPRQETGMHQPEGWGGEGVLRKMSGNVVWGRFPEEGRCHQ